jgi:ElaB/YqjD/DUF883 family membrane-anchored ribosome-binding protein
MKGLSSFEPRGFAKSPIFFTMYSQIGMGDDLTSERRRMMVQDNKEYLDELSRAGERLGHRAAQKIGEAAEAAGRKVDATMETMSAATQSARDSLEGLRKEGWDGMRRTAMAYTRKEPFTALMLALGVGICLGCWLTKRQVG